MKNRFLLLVLILFTSCNSDDIITQNDNKKLIVSEDKNNSIYFDAIVSPPYTFTDKFGLGLRKVDNGTTLYTHVIFTEGAITYGMDSYDALINASQYGAPWCIYTTYPDFDKKFFRNHCSTPFNENDKMDIGLTCSISGYYEILLHYPSCYGLFLNNQPIYLWDKFEDIKVNLQESNYIFYTESFTLKSNRFSLSYTP